MTASFLHFKQIISEFVCFYFVALEKCVLEICNLWNAEWFGRQRSTIAHFVFNVLFHFRCLILAISHCWHRPKFLCAVVSPNLCTFYCVLFSFIDRSKRLMAIPFCLIINVNHAFAMRLFFVHLFKQTLLLLSFAFVFGICRTATCLFKHCRWNVVIVFKWMYNISWFANQTHENWRFDSLENGTLVCNWNYLVANWTSINCCQAEYQRQFYLLRITCF